MDSPTKVGEGQVEIVLDGEAMVLKPTLFAAQQISRQSGGIMGAIESVLKLDLDTITTVIGLGLGYGPGRKAPPELAEKVWKSGLTDSSEGAIVERCTLFLRVLANGGRMPMPLEEMDSHPPQS